MAKKTNKKTANLIRKIYTDNPRITQTELGKRYGLTQGAIRHIVMNESFHDPEYTPPTNTTCRGSAGGGHWSWYERRADERMAREYPFSCDFCGSGYDDEDKARDCCENASKIIPIEERDRMRCPKYSDKQGRALDKYEHSRAAWASRGNH